MKKTIFLASALLFACYNLKAQNGTNILYFDRDGNEPGSEGLFINGGVGGGGTITTFRSYTTENVSEVNFRATRDLRVKGSFFAERNANVHGDFSVLGNSRFSKIGFGITPQEAIHLKDQNIRVDNGEYQSWGVMILHPDVDKSGDDRISFRNSQNEEMAWMQDGVFRTHNGIFNNELTAEKAQFKEGSFGSITYTKNTGKLSLGHGKDEKISFTDGDNKEMASLKDGILTLDKVVLNVGSFPDYVFADEYRLMPLEEVASYIKKNKHLPNMPSEAEVVAKGMNVAQINTILVEKVEELTLHTIKQEEKINMLLKELQAIKKAVEATKK